jgi:acyl-CoA thioester hydrolase
LDDVVIVETELLQVGRVAIDLRQTVWLQSAQPVRLCTGEIRVGWVDAVTLKPTRMSPTLINALKRP